MSQFLQESQILRKAPSVFATSGSKSMSSRYQFIPTIDVLRALNERGFNVVDARQSKKRDEIKQGFAKHMIRLRHDDFKIDERTGLTPEIILINSHDGSSSYTIRGGIYRFACCNGLVVGNDQFCSRIKHTGNVIDDVTESAAHTIEIMPLSVKKANEWSDITLTDAQRLVLAETATQLKWESGSAPVTPRDVLNIRRSADNKKDLWTTFNVIQENLLKGGLHYVCDKGKRSSTRRVKSVNEDIRLNTALWSLTEKMAELV